MQRVEDMKSWRLLGPQSLIPAVAASLIAIVTVLLAYTVFASTPLIQADLSTYVLPAQFRIAGLGSIYVDLFDIKPPLAYAMFVPWVAVFGVHLVQFWLLYALLMLITFAGFWYLIRRFLNPWYSLIVFSSCAGTLVGLGMLEELFFTTEIVCLALILSALTLIYRYRTSMHSAFAAGFLITSAGQVKEVFILAPLALIPLLLQPRINRRKRLIGAVVGCASAIALTIAVLLFWGNGSLGAYLEILKFKRERFPAPGLTGVAHDLSDYLHQLILWLPLIGVFVGLVLVLVLLKKIGKRFQGSEKSWNAEFTSAAILFLAILAGFIWQGAPLVLHYALALIFPLYIMLAAVLAWSLNVISGTSASTRVVVTALLIAGLLPSLTSVAWVYGRTTSLSPSGLVSSIKGLESTSDLEIFGKISELTGSSDCIQAAYGWSATSFYLYTDRKSCSRFVVPPLALDPAYRTELQADLIARPPAVLIADRSLSGQTALPASEGTPETTIFPFEAVISNCYRAVPGWPILFTPSSGEQKMTSDCIAGQVDSIIQDSGNN
jgi:hypothetical protein